MVYFPTMRKPEEREAFKARITEAIENGPASQKQIAEFCDISETAVSRWKTTGRIDRDNLLALSQISGFRYLYLRDGAGPKRFNDKEENRLEFKVAEEPTPYDYSVEALKKSPAAQELMETVVFALANRRISESAIRNLSRFIRDLATDN